MNFKEYLEYIKEAEAFEFAWGKGENAPLISPLQPNINPTKKFVPLADFIKNTKSYHPNINSEEQVNILLSGLKNSKKIKDFDISIFQKKYEDKFLYLSGLIKKHFPDMDISQIDLTVKKDLDSEKETGKVASVNLEK